MSRSYDNSDRYHKPSTADTPSLAGRGGSRHSLCGGEEGHKPRPPSYQLDRPTIRNFGRLGQALARLQVVQTQLPLHGPAHIGFAPPWMLDQRAPLDALRERAAVELALAALLWLEAMELA